MTKEKPLSEQWKEGYDLGYEKALEEEAKRVKKLKEEALKDSRYINEANMVSINCLFTQINSIFGEFDNHSPVDKGDVKCISTSAHSPLDVENTHALCECGHNEEDHGLDSTGECTHLNVKGQFDCPCKKFEENVTTIYGGGCPEYQEKKGCGEEVAEWFICGEKSYLCPKCEVDK